LANEKTTVRRQDHVTLDLKPLDGERFRFRRISVNDSRRRLI